MPEPLKFTLLWHMHQPFYRDPLTGGFDLPWTYLHGVKDYFDMAAIVEESDCARVVFNLVPSLLEQIAAYADASARDPILDHAAMTPADMSAEERLFVLDNFFSANRERMIEPYPRYLELRYLLGNGGHGSGAERLRSLGDQEILDLQVWFLLAWTGPVARRRFPGLAELCVKGRDFSRGDKEFLLDAHRAILGDIIPLYRRLHEQGKAELSLSPYFHPILPLLCDTSSARAALPRVNLPVMPCRCPEDARAQVMGGLRLFRELFGSVPRGMWPPEGSISDETLDLLGECGLDWAASDEGILAASLPDGLGEGKGALYHPYVYSGNGHDMDLFFRDRDLSDLIGFTYANWPEERAVEDFVGRLVAIREAAPGAERVTVALDGENAWEYFRDNGYRFLEGLYRRIGADPNLRFATPSEEGGRPGVRRLDHVHPGSWINADFGIWIGHPEENCAWDCLSRARAMATERSREVAALLNGGDGAGCLPAAEQTVAGRVARSLYIAQGSDWFWWFGDDHFSPHSDRFDRLFRHNLINACRQLDADVPGDLLESIKKVSPAGLVRKPAALISPRLNGLVDDYFEWLGAGLYDLSRQSSAMHAGESLLHCLFYGYDREFLYIRVDGASPLDRALLQGDVLRFHILAGREYLVSMAKWSSEGELLAREQGDWRETGFECRWVISQVCEARIPLAALSLGRAQTFFAYATLTRGQDEIGRWPVHAPLALSYEGPEIELENWLV